MQAWYYNVWKNRDWLRTGEWKRMYCSKWCFITNQRFCRKGK